MYQSIRDSWLSDWPNIVLQCANCLTKFMIKSISSWLWMLTRSPPLSIHQALASCQLLSITASVLVDTWYSYPLYTVHLLFSHNTKPTVKWTKTTYHKLRTGFTLISTNLRSTKKLLKICIWISTFTEPACFKQFTFLKKSWANGIT